MASFLTNAILFLGRNTPLGNGDARRLLTNILERHDKGPFLSSFRGVPYEFHLDNSTERKALFGSYNNAELDFLLSFLKDGNSVFVDIGANCGFYTQYLSAKAPSGTKTIAVEPNGTMSARLERNRSLLAPALQQSNPVILEKCAVGESAGSAFLALDRGFGEAHVVSEKTNDTISIQVKSLLDILRSHTITKIDALKIDIEGYEDRAFIPFFRDADKSLFPKAIIIEHTSERQWASDLFSVLRLSGYTETRRTRGNAFLKLSP